MRRSAGWWLPIFAIVGCVQPDAPDAASRTEVLDDRSSVPQAGQVTPATAAADPVPVAEGLPAPTADGGISRHEERLVVSGEGLGRPTSLEIGPDGLLYMAFPFEGLVRVVDPTRGVVRTSEVSSANVRNFPARLGWSNERLWCVDSENTVIEYLDRGLAPERSVRLTVPQRFGPVLPRRVVGVRPDGRLIVTASPEPMATVLADGGIPDHMIGRIPPPLLAAPTTHVPVLVIDAAASIVDTLALLSTRGRYGVVFPEDDASASVSIFEQPFASYPRFHIDPTGTHAVIADGSAPAGGYVYTLHRVGVAGDTLSTVNVPGTTVPIQGEWVQHAVAEIGRRAGDSERARTQAESAVVVPTILPTVSGLVVGRGGWVWVGRERVPGSDHVVWDILDASNARIGSIALRPELIVVAVESVGAFALEDSGTYWTLWHIQVPQGPT